MAASATHRAIDAVWRIESARLIAGLTRIVGDLSVAEDLAQDALVAALEQWPGSGIPDNPGAWGNQPGRKPECAARSPAILYRSPGRGQSAWPSLPPRSTT